VHGPDGFDAVILRERHRKTKRVVWSMMMHPTLFDLPVIPASDDDPDSDTRVVAEEAVRRVNELLAATETAATFTELRAAVTAATDDARLRRAVARSRTLSVEWSLVRVTAERRLGALHPPPGTGHGGVRTTGQRNEQSQAERTRRMHERWFAAIPQTVWDAELAAAVKANEPVVRARLLDLGRHHSESLRVVTDTGHDTPDGFEVVGGATLSTATLLPTAPTRSTAGPRRADITGTHAPDDGRAIALCRPDDVAATIDGLRAEGLVFTTVRVVPLKGRARRDARVDALVAVVAERPGGAADVGRAVVLHSVARLVDVRDAVGTALGSDDVRDAPLDAGAA
jgi:hypothetical protein